jgi:hypothetical protein
MSNERPDLNKIRTDYQVADDNTTQWVPQLGGIPVRIPGVAARTLTETEGRMLDGLASREGLLGLQRFRDAAETAERIADERFPRDNPVPKNIPQNRANEWQANDGHNDAMRHTLWNALMTQQFGRGWTSTYATAHEALPGNPANREAMDLYNNAVGRSIGAANPNATPEQLADKVQEAMNQGKLIVMNSQGNLEWSDRVPVGKHGLTPDEVLGPKLPVPQPNNNVSSIEGTNQNPALGTQPHQVALAAADPGDTRARQPAEEQLQNMNRMYNDPVFLQAAKALDEKDLNVQGAHVPYSAALAANLTAINNIEPGKLIADANGQPDRNYFVFGDKPQGATGPEYGMFSQKDLQTVTAQQSADTAAVALAAQDNRTQTQTQDLNEVQTKKGFSMTA